MIDWQMIAAVVAAASFILPIFTKTITALARITSILTQLEADVKELRKHDRDHEKRIAQIEGRLDNDL